MSHGTAHRESTTGDTNTKADRELVGVVVGIAAYHPHHAPSGRPVVEFIARADAGDDVCAQCKEDLA